MSLAPSGIMHLLLTVGTRVPLLVDDNTGLNGHYLPRGNLIKILLHPKKGGFGEEIL